MDRGLIDLDAPLLTYLPDFHLASPDYARITVRMLLSQAAGLPGDEARNASTLRPFPEFANQVRHSLRSQRLKHTPGEMAVVCADCFTLIEGLIATVTGTRYTQFVHQEVLAPLGMRHSGFADQIPAPGSYLPAGWADGRPWPPIHDNAYAARGLSASPGDLARLAVMLINQGQLDGRRLLTAEAVAALGRDQARDMPLNRLANHDRQFGLGQRRPGGAGGGGCAGLADQRAGDGPGSALCRHLAGGTGGATGAGWPLPDPQQPRGAGFRHEFQPVGEFAGAEEILKTTPRNHRRWAGLGCGTKQYKIHPTT